MSDLTDQLEVNRLTTFIAVDSLNNQIIDQLLHVFGHNKVQMIEARPGHAMIFGQMYELGDQCVNILWTTQGIIFAGIRVCIGGYFAQIIVWRQILAIELTILLAAPVVLTELVRGVQLQIMDALVAGGASRMRFNQDLHGCLSIEREVS